MPPFAFNGTLRAERSTKGISGVDRWYEMRVYSYTNRIGVDGSVIAIGYRTERDHETALDWAWGCNDNDYSLCLRPVILWAVEHDIATYLTGLPGGQQFEDKRAQIVRQLRTALLANLAHLFGDAGIVEEL